jgi:hypothetical protein
MLSLAVHTVVATLCTVNGRAVQLLGSLGVEGFECADVA